MPEGVGRVLATEGEGMKDPLAGKRRDIMARKVKVLIWPAVDDNGFMLGCPVEKGQRFDVSGVPVIEIERVTRKLPAGRKAEWHATFIRHEVDRPQLLRRVPSGLPSSDREHVGLSDVEKARVDGNYTSSLALSVGREEPESVGPDWEDMGVAERAKNRIEARSELRAEEEAERANRQVRAELGRVLKGLTPENKLALLAQIQRDCEQAETKEAA